MDSVAAVAAAELGIPGHLPMVSRAQIFLVSLLIGGPVALVWIHGDSVLAAATVIAAAAAMGVLIVMLPVAWAGVAITIGLLNGPLHGLMYWLAQPPAQILILLASAAVLYRWYVLASSIGIRALRGGSALADAAHERVGDSAVDDHGLRERLEAFEAKLDRTVAVATTGVEAGNLSPRTLGAGMGFDTDPSPRALFKSLGVVLVAICVWHFAHGEHPESLGYFIVTGLVAVHLLSRVSNVYGAWRSSPVEQELLLLMPRLESRSRLKWQFLAALARTQVDGWMIWAVTGVAVGAGGWVGIDDVAFGAVIVVAASCAALSDVWAIWAAPSVGNWQRVSSGAILLSILFGVVAWRSGAVRIGLASILLPAAIAFLAIAIRPLQFPVVSKLPGGVH